MSPAVGGGRRALVVIDMQAVFAAADDGMPVEVVADACAGLSPADHQRALDAMALYAPLITITSVAGLDIDGVPTTN